MKTSEFRYISDEDRKVWERFNATDVFYAEQRSIVAMFYQAVAENPERPAVSIKGQDMSYAQLNERSNRIANFLIAQGVKAGDTVAVAFSRDHHLYAAIMGILKAGGAYVPIECDDPLERIRYIFDNARIRSLLTGQQFYTAHRSDLTAQVVAVLDGEIRDNDENRFSSKDIEAYSSKNVATDIDVQLPMYVIYTSGTTGRPKGVKISQDSVINFTHWFCDAHDVSSESRLCQNAPISFDPSAQQIFPAFTSGATLLPVPEEILRDPYLFLVWLRDERITHLDVVTSHWVHMLNALEGARDRSLGKLPDLQWIVIGGETLYYHQTYLWHRLTVSPVKFDNIYGPTEATINATTFLVDFAKKEGKIPIGQPLPNYKIYVLDQNRRLCPLNVVGEIYIGGRGVALGYQDEEQTQKAFISDPFSDISGDRLYKTGDLGSLVMGEDGDAYLEFGGRIDSQVKISGYRIEPEEIEIVIKSLPEVQDAAVAVWGDDTNKQLVCFFTSPSLTQEDIRKHLWRCLPAYMVPGAYLRLDTLFFTRNGKMDKQKLLELYERDKRHEFRDAVLPRTPLERDMERIWRGLLNLDRLSVHDNVFEIGANSFLTLTFLTRLQAIIDCECRIADIYNNPTVAELASFLEERRRKLRERSSSPGSGRPSRLREDKLHAADSRSSAFPQAAIEGLIETILNPGFVLKEIRQIDMSPANRRTLLRGVNLSAQTIVNLQMNVALDSDIFEKVVREILASHTLLRVAARKLDGDRFTFVEFSFENVTIPYIDLRGYARDIVEECYRQLQELLAREFELTKPPLFRFVLIRVEQEVFRFIWCISHLISDGESVNLITRELKERYWCHIHGDEFHTGQALATYDDYVRDIRSMSESNLNTYLDYFEHFIDCVEHITPAIETVITQEHTLFEEIVTLDVRSLQHGESADLISILCAICAGAVSKWIGCDQVPFMSLYHGRVYRDRSYFSFVADCTDLVPFLVPGVGNKEQLLFDVRDVLASINNRQVNYARILEQIGMKEDKRYMVEMITRPSHPFWFGFFEEVGTDLESDADFLLLNNPDGYESDRHGSIHFSTVKRNNQVDIILIGWGIEKSSMIKLRDMLDLHIEAFRIKEGASNGPF